MKGFIAEIKDVNCPKCGKKSFVSVNYINADTLDGRSSIKELAKFQQRNCNCKELDEEAQRVYDEMPQSK